MAQNDADKTIARERADPAEWALSHAAFLATEYRHTKSDDADVYLCIKAGWAVWLPGEIPGMRRVGLTTAGEERLCWSNAP